MEHYFLGVDIGSLTTKIVLLDEGGKIVAQATRRSGYRGKETAERLLEDLLRERGLGREQIAKVAATGYGRITFPADREISEITCQARGINHLFRGVRTIIDIGGQDSKVIKILPSGRVGDFVMNDKCAAGTGRFLEVMSQALEVDLEELGRLAGLAEKAAAISSTCTVFAESEVVSYLAQGAERSDIIAGLCASVAARVAALVSRVGVEKEVLLTGGVARNQGVVRALQEKLGLALLIPPEPSITAALGAALFARDLARNNENVTIKTR
ncbi:MAG: acyl-CoA dehydratase activase [Firmicutes bacterium]|nr:acyl-CoA dehydratase activase [Bacillota bacterium]MCL5038778.1 acyl-CoA dehydratase activase [Bacillota bacterium]